jgi:hypothetical protein
VAATRGIDECLRGGLVDVPSTMLRYPPSISSSVGTRSFCECARIWQSEYDLVTRNQPLFGRGTFFRDQQSRLPALQCSHDHPPSRGAHTKELAVSTCEAAHSFRWPAMVVRCALATALVSTPEFALLSQRLTHASQTWRRRSHGVPRLSLPTCPSTRWCRIGTYSVRQSCQHHA